MNKILSFVLVLAGVLSFLFLLIIIASNAGEGRQISICLDEKDNGLDVFMKDGGILGDSCYVVDNGKEISLIEYRQNHKRDGIETRKLNNDAFRRLVKND